MNTYTDDTIATFLIFILKKIVFFLARELKFVSNVFKGHVFIHERFFYLYAVALK